MTSTDQPVVQDEPSIVEALYDATNSLKRFESAKLEAELLLAFVLKKNRTYLYTWPDQKLSLAQSGQFNEAIAERLTEKPIAYILGTQEFWSFSLNVNEHTLIPRPDTEILVEAALERLQGTNLRAADLGTGSGAIACALASERPSWKIDATDQCKNALDVAVKNVEQLQLHNVRCLPGNWCNALPAERYDVIVSNPPYIEPNDPHLTESGLPYEPISALVSAESGLRDIKEITLQAAQYLLAGGLLVIEHGYNQGAAVRDVFSQMGYEKIETVQDLGQCDRVTLGYLPAEQ